MKYANSLKYMNAFKGSTEDAHVSLRRVSELCTELGRINVGVRALWLPSGSAGHATAVVLESVIKNAGYRVGRVTSTGRYDSRMSVYLDGEQASIDDYNKSVAELKNVIGKKTDEEYLKEETAFVLSLLLCKIYGCEYIIFEGTTNEYFSLDSVCAPYDLIIVPPVREDKETDKSIELVCDAIKRGVREVVSGNQKSAVYNRISSACVNCGARLNFTAKPTFSTGEVSSMKLTFSYAERDGYTLKSPSILLRESAMLVIESALAIRRDGVKLPWGSISAGIADAHSTGCFDMISISPAIVADTAESPDELEMLLGTVDQVLGKTEDLAFCVSDSSRYELCEKLEAFSEKKVTDLIIFAEADAPEPQIPEKYKENVTVCTTIIETAKAIHKISNKEPIILCCGSVGFIKELKFEFLRLMGY